MGFYGKYVLPTLIELAMKNKAAQAERGRVVPRASGEVLEIGVGSGLNIPIYGSGVRKLHALDPSAELLRMARQRAERAAFPVELLQHPAEAIPLGDGTVDSVVTTWTLCSIPDAASALREVRRVLRPTGRPLLIAPRPPADP